MDCVISKLCYKGTILQRKNRKMTMKWSFSYFSFVKSFGKKSFACYNVTMCYNKVCFK